MLVRSAFLKANCMPLIGKKTGRSRPRSHKVLLFNILGLLEKKQPATAACTPPREHVASFGHNIGQNGLLFATK